MLPDEGAEIDPVPSSGGAYQPKPELDRLSNIVKSFNDRFGGIQWDNADRVRQLVTETIPSRVADNSALRNARRNSDRENTRKERGRILERIMDSLLR